MLCLHKVYANFIKKDPGTTVFRGFLNCLNCCITGEKRGSQEIVCDRCATGELQVSDTKM